MNPFWEYRPQIRTEERFRDTGARAHFYVRKDGTMLELTKYKLKEAEMINKGDKIKVTYNHEDQADVVITRVGIAHIHSDYSGNVWLTEGRGVLYNPNWNILKVEVLEKAKPEVGTRIKGVDRDGDSFIGVTRDNNIDVIYDDQQYGYISLIWNEVLSWELV